MPRNSNHASKSAVVARVARRQEGLVSGRQLEACGVGDGQLEHWVREGRLTLVLHTVFAVGDPTLRPRARMRAAALTCPGSVVSHRSAAALLGIGEVAPLVVDLIPSEQRGRKIDGIKSHRVAFPGRRESTAVHGIVCTNVARTVVDLAGTYGEDGLRKTFERATAEGKLDLGAIQEVLEAGGKRRGAPALRRVIEDWRPVAETARYATVRSLFEAKLLPLVAAANLPMPRINAPVRTAERVLEVDLLWDEERFVVEADSRRHHGTEAAFERDRTRDLELMEVHYEVLRVTWKQVEREAPQVFAVIRSELERRGERRRKDGAAA
jgi:very-short-patch-repair endonuclease